MKAKSEAKSQCRSLSGHVAQLIVLDTEAKAKAKDRAKNRAKEGWAE